MSGTETHLDPDHDEERTSERRLFELLTATNNDMAVLHRELGQKTRALEEAITRNNEFLGMAAHDLRNPLHVIGGMSKVLLRSANISDKERNLLKSISASSAFMKRLVDDLLQVSEVEAGKLRLQRESFSLGELVAERLELQRLAAADKRIGIESRFQAGAPPISGDRMRLTQVIDNLLSNAIKYSQPSTTVMVQLHAGRRMMRLSVRDQGQGIAKEELDRLFQPFGVTSTRATAGEKSTGLGLMIVKRIAEAHGGCVYVRSRLGVGTTFHLFLPLSADASPA
ncbi:MAG: HAMP domain-containing sensor histidine kinase [bacterium]